MADIDLAEVQRELEANGFAAREGTLADIRTSTAGWATLSQARGAKVAKLRPMTETEARPRTLSAIHGLQAQPLHTDGAHLKRMPDVIVLFAAKPTGTPTAVWKLPSRFPECLRSGVFTVRGNVESFLSHAYSNQRLRFDPGCMSPADHLAKEAAAFFGAVHSEAHRHVWEGGSLLFIDNRTALHGRDAVESAADAENRLLERATFTLEK